MWHQMVSLDDCFREHLLLGSLEWEDGNEEMKGKVEGTAWMNRILRTHANDFILNLNLKQEILAIFKEIKTDNFLEQDKTTRILPPEEILLDSLLIKYGVVE